MVTMFRFPVEVREWLVALAAREKRTLIAQVLLIFEEWRAMKERDGADQPPAS